MPKQIEVDANDMRPDADEAEQKREMEEVQKDAAEEREEEGGYQ